MDDIKIFHIHYYKRFMGTAGDYFVVFTNLSSLPCIIYFQYHRKYYYSIQILLTSFFSFMHHLNQSKVYSFDDSAIFDLLDGLYSYYSIYVFAIYLFLKNHTELKLEQSLMQTILLCFVYLKLDSIIVLPVTSFLILFITSIYYTQFNKLSLCNKYIYITFLLCSVDIACFFIGMHIEYNYLHGIHHLITFNIPIFIDKCIPP